MKRVTTRPIDRRPSARRTGGTRPGSHHRNRRAPVFEVLEGRALLSGIFTSLAHAAPDNLGTMMLESDGSVIAQGGDVTNTWYRLTPDSTGSYVNGTWTQVASMNVQRLYFGSNVLNDGRIFVQGGEYSGPFGLSNDNNTGEIYNPVTNTWTSIATFPQGSFGDDPSEVLPNGNVLAGYLGGAQTYAYNPTSNTWTQAGTKLRGDQSDEEAWVKLPDGSILSYDVFSSINTGVGHAQRYIPSSNTWVDAGTLDELLSTPSVGYELGPGFLLPDGRAFYLGANGNTAYYTPSTNSWTDGPVIPDGLGADDAPGAMMPDGKILFTADTPLFNGPAHIFEYDPVAETYTDLTSLVSASYFSGPSFVDRMLMLPSGQVLVSNGGSQLYVYTPDLPPVASSVPTITNISENADGSYLLSGTGLNGISEGAAYGDDAEMSSNYPIVRLTDPNGVVYSARTSGWSSNGVATGSTPETTNFTLPVGLPANTYNVSVVANGVASSTTTLVIPSNGADPAPTFAVAASATPSPVAGTTTTLSALGADTQGESTLTYNWAATTVPGGAILPSFASNGTNASKSDVVTFYHSGNYVFTVTATNLAGLSAASTVGVTVNQTLTSITVSPNLVNVNPGATRQFSASALDQFGRALSSQPGFTWTLTSGGGTLSTGGLYHAPGTGTLAVVSAKSGSTVGTAQVFVLSSPWVTADIGSPLIAGAAGDDGSGDYTLVASGSDISGTSDQFRFAYQTLTGDGAIVARVASEQNTNTFAKAGVMIRSSTAANSQEALMAITPGSGATFQYRSSTGGGTAASTFAGPKAPYWVRLVRSGNTFTGYYSSDGVNWTQEGSTTIAMGTTVDIGLALTSHNATALNTSTFDHVTIDTTPTVVNAASASPSPVAGTTTTLSALGADNLGESTLTYTWAATTVPNGAPTPTFSSNGTNASKSDIATFHKAGSYTFQVTITNSVGLSITSSVNVTVNQTLTSVVVSPSSATLAQSGTQQFSAVGDDQFGQALTSQPSITYSVVPGGAGGTIGTSGLYTAPATGFGPDTIDASSGGFVGPATANVTQAPAITTAPTGQAVLAGQTVTFTAAAVGYPAPTVQWMASTDGVNFSPVTNATSPTLTFAAQLSQNDDLYEAVFTNSAGTATAGPVTLNVFSTLTVSSFAPTSTGFTATFDVPFSLASLHLYTTAAANLGPADVTLVGAGTGPIQGSLIVNPNNQAITFVKTGGILPPDTYTVTFLSSVNGFQTPSASLLDGNDSGIPGTNYTTTFTVAPSSNPVVAIPDFARGPGQPVIIPAATGTGLPLTISDGTNVTSISLTLTYNPSLLTITGANPGASAPVGSMVNVDTSTPGVAILTFTSPTALASGLDNFATLVASVPNAAPYASKEDLVLGNISVNAGAIPATDQDGVHVVAYLGDTTGNGGYSGLDASLIARVVANIDSGFAAFPLADPTILGDIAGRGSLTAQDAAFVAQFVANVPQARIPALPGVTITKGGPDPLIWLPQDLDAAPGSTLTVPVLFRQTNGSSIGLDSADIAIEFDPSIFMVNSVSLGNIPEGFTLTESYDNATGEIIASARSTSGPITLTPGTEGALLLIKLTVRPGAALGAARLNLLAEGRVGSRILYTALNDGYLTLTPAPSDLDTDPTDGIVTVTVPLAPQPTIPTTAPPAISTFTPILGSTATPAGPFPAIGPAIGATGGESPIASRPASLDDLATVESSGSTVTDLIPWTAADPSASLTTPDISASILGQKKAKNGQAILGQTASDGVRSRALDER